MSLESSPTGWYLVLIYSNYNYILFCSAINVFGKYILIWEFLRCRSHTVHNREIWDICKRYVGEWYTCRIVPKGMFQ